MKKFLYVLFFVVMGVSTQAQKINWISFNEAIAAQKKNPKPLFIDVYTNWCPPCKMLDQNTFTDPKLAQYINANYYAVKFNAEGNESVAYLGKTYTNPNFDSTKSVSGRNSLHQFAMYLKVQAYPSMVVIDANNKISSNIMGYQTAEQLLTQL